ncbi:hypothetical protein AYI68_g1781 [Smittium mucronatum]|uniref:Equilibrative nucleoside transporter 1 n=1 Tax=Smittium mucronatum TaxID=133383 RepID=A0A1R0H4M5_9FUNG|nr:hypothetical protein AYI68_g1781 [Smittium mucronatum]
MNDLRSRDNSRISLVHNECSADRDPLENDPIFTETSPNEHIVVSRFINYTFVLCGISTLFGWNALITAFPFFEQVFKGEQFEKSFRNTFSLVYTFVGLVTFGISLSTQNRVITAYITSNDSEPEIPSRTRTKLSPGLKLRTLVCFLITACILAMTTIMFIKMIKQQLFIDLIDLKSIENSIPQSGSVNDDTPDPDSPIPKQLFNGKSAEIWATIVSVKHYSHAILMCFIATLCIFPSLTSLVVSVGGRLGIKNLVEWHFVMFNFGDYIGRHLAQFVFIISNWMFCTVSYISKAFSSRNRTRVLGVERDYVYVWFMVIFSYLRWLFLPYFTSSNLSCKPSSLSNVTKRMFNQSLQNGILGESKLLPPSTDVIGTPGYSSSSDIWFLILTLIFGISGGFIASCIMIAGPKNSINPPLAGSILGFFILTGLAIGSCFSFLVTYLAC